MVAKTKCVRLASRRRASGKGSRAMWETDDKQPRKVSADERRVMIVDEVNSRTSIHVSDICEHFGISEVTARSDLDKLERAGKLRRTHGGAVSITRTITISYPDQRMNLNVDAKRKVAECAADLVMNGDSLFVDSGTTTLEFVRLLGSKHNITIVTNDLSIATFADSNLPHADVVLLGGALRKNHRYITGSIANDILSRLYVDKAFMGTDSFDVQQGFATEFTGNAEIKRGHARPFYFAISCSWTHRSCAGRASSRSRASRISMSS